MEKRTKIHVNKPKTPTFARPPSEPPALSAVMPPPVVTPAPPAAPPTFAGPTAEIDRLIFDIETDIQAARADGDTDLSEKLRGRLIQAQRMRSKALDDSRKHELRLIDSLEWKDLSAKLARMVAGCDRCRDAVLRLLEGTDDDGADA